MFFLVGINVFTVAVKVGEKQKDIVDGSIFFKKKKRKKEFSGLIVYLEHLFIIYHGHALEFGRSIF